MSHYQLCIFYMVQVTFPFSQVNRAKVLDISSVDGGWFGVKSYPFSQLIGSFVLIHGFLDCFNTYNHGVA